jgi:hypothetical protein
MRRIWIFILSIAILGGAVIFELWTNVLYPIFDLEPGALPPLTVGVEREYDYFKDHERVGSYSFLVESRGTYKQSEAYFTRSKASITYGETSAELESVYIFSEELAPLEYRLNTSIGGENQSIDCFFEDRSVNGTFVLGDDVVQESAELPESTVLIDYLMLGHWDLLFKSSPLEPGKRYKVNAYIPQSLSYTSLELYADKNTNTIEIGGVEYMCRVVKATALNLVFYIYEGDIVQLEDTEQSIIVSISGQG